MRAGVESIQDRMEYKPYTPSPCINLEGKQGFHFRKLKFIGGHR
jgi:hypothetical protein